MPKRFDQVLSQALPKLLGTGFGISRAQSSSPVAQVSLGLSALCRLCQLLKFIYFITFCCFFSSFCRIPCTSSSSVLTCRIQTSYSKYAPTFCCPTHVSLGFSLLRSDIRVTLSGLVLRNGHSLFDPFSSSLTASILKMILTGSGGSRRSRCN